MIEKELVRHWADLMRALLRSMSTSTKDYRRRLRALGIAP